VDLDDYTAWRIGCDPKLLRTPGTHVVAAVPGRHEWLGDPFAATDPDAICLLERRGVSVVRTSVTPGSRVTALLERLPSDHAVSADEIAGLVDGELRRYGVDLYLYVGESSFRSVPTDGVRQLGPGDADHVAGVHAAVDPRMTWYVEIDHSVVFGRFVGNTLVSIASHFVFPGHGIAAAGVLTHRDHRRRGHGTAVVSAAVVWALEHGLVCEWVTDETNLASLALARRLGFEDHEHETEFRLGAR
jgi:GNAT superfamily N-acetyltransferase